MMKAITRVADLISTELLLKFPLNSAPAHLPSSCLNSKDNTILNDVATYFKISLNVLGFGIKEGIDNMVDRRRNGDVIHTRSRCDNGFNVVIMDERWLGWGVEIANDESSLTLGLLKDDRIALILGDVRIIIVHFLLQILLYFNKIVGSNFNLISALISHTYYNNISWTTPSHNLRNGTSNSPLSQGHTYQLPSSWLAYWASVFSPLMIYYMISEPHSSPSKYGDPLPPWSIRVSSRSAFCFQCFLLTLVSAEFKFSCSIGIHMQITFGYAFAFFFRS